MKIGNIDLGARPVLLAPMEDVSDIGFRLLCRRMGAGMVYSEFVSSDALTRQVARTIEKLTISQDERPVAIQIYGKYPEAMAEAARIVEETSHPDILDLNFGCPVKRVAGKGAGAGLLQNIPLMLDITRAVVDAVSIPVTAKTRLGWDHNHIIIGDLAEQLQDAGIQALTVHGRTRSQMYTGQADWNPIAELKKNPRLHIPIIGNGDIDSAQKAVKAFDDYGVDAVMVGRASFGRPWIFKEIYDALHPEQSASTRSGQSSVSGEQYVGNSGQGAVRGGQDAGNIGQGGIDVDQDGRSNGYYGTGEGQNSNMPFAIESEYPPMSADWKLDVLKTQAMQSVERLDERRGILHFRRHIAATPLFKGIPNFRDHRIAMLRAETIEHLFSLMEQTRPLLREKEEMLKNGGFITENGQVMMPQNGDALIANPD